MYPGNETDISFPTSKNELTLLFRLYPVGEPTSFIETS